MSESDIVAPRLPRPLRLVRDRLDQYILSACIAATRHVTRGRLRLTLPSGRSAILGSGGDVEADLQMRNLRLFANALRRGSIGVAESFMAGDFETRDLGNVFRFFLDNKSTLHEAGRGQFRVRLGDTLWHRRRDNSRAGSRRNIAAHYDLGNAFYAAWLDRTMTYSSALYTAPGQTLEDAQAHKIERIIEALDVRPGMRVLEIGCGWGALSIELARRGARVMATTISREQLAYTRAAAAKSGTGDRLEVCFCDYRDVTGTFDRIVSVEMIEAVGEVHWPAYFATLRDRLQPGGQAIVQAITIKEASFAHYRAKADFIQRYIFPGGMLPTERVMSAEATRAALTYAPVLRFASSYAQTLSAWRERFEAAWPQLLGMGFDERFRRMWLYYLIYCEVGFERGAVDVGLYRFTKA